MSYDFRVIDKRKKCHNTVTTKGRKFPFRCYGGTIRCNSDFSPANIIDFDFNMTYNYSHVLKKTKLMKKSIRSIYNKSIDECIDILEKTCLELKVRFIDKWFECFNKNHMDADPNSYWTPNPHNVYTQLQHILMCLHWIRKSYKKTYHNFTIVGD